MNELRILANIIPGKIDTNFEEQKAVLAQSMELYKNAKFSEEYKTQAKGELATLRKIRKALDDRRKEVKKEWMGPYEEFESKTKELLQLIDEPISLIDAQIKEMEKQRKAARRKEIGEFFGDIASDLLEYVSLGQIYDNRWENASTSTKAWKTDLSGQITRIQNDVEVINANTSEAVPQALEEYKKTHDLAKASMVIAAYERQKEEILKREEERQRAKEEQNRRQELERIRQEERERIAAEERIREEERKKAAEEAAKKQQVSVHNIPEPETSEESGFDAEGFVVDELPFEQPHTQSVFYRVDATPEELEQVEMVFNSIGIFFERRNENE